MALPDVLSTLRLFGLHISGGKRGARGSSAVQSSGSRGICQGYHEHTGCCTTHAHCTGFTTFPEWLTVLFSFCLPYSQKSSLLLETAAAMTGTPIQLPGGCRTFFPGRVITCRNIRNGQSSGSPNLVVLSLWKWKWAMLFRDSKSAAFNFFCPQSPAPMFHWIRDIGGHIQGYSIYLRASCSWHCPILSWACWHCQSP